MKTPTTLIIMDGFGLSTSTAAGDNAIYTAATPNLEDRKSTRLNSSHS